jgi:pSer/pThr/pTyr-binding forkhead associated (FHA) protein
VSVWTRFERRLEGLVEGAFARAFKSELQPVEVARALAREVDDRAAIIGKGRVLIPNDFVVEIGETDHNRLSVYSDSLGTELATVVKEHAAEEGYHLVGPVQVRFRHADDLRTGVFRVRSGVQPSGRPAPRQQPAFQNAPQHDGGYGQQQYDQGPAPQGYAMPEPIPFPVQGGPQYAPPQGYGGQQPYGEAPQPYLGQQGSPDDERTRVTPLRPRRQARLETVDGEVVGWLTAPAAIIGRGSESDVKISDPGISRRHAEIRTENGEYVVTDLGSTNGTIVDGRPVRRASLYDGSRVQFGRTTLTFRVDG